MRLDSRAIKTCSEMSKAARHFGHLSCIEHEHHSALFDLSGVGQVKIAADQIYAKLMKML